MSMAFIIPYHAGLAVGIKTGDIIMAGDKKAL